MKGSDQCPKCGSRKWGDARQDITDFYATVLRVCGNCRCAWEPFEIIELSDPTVPTDAFKTPCNNCAFRKGSHEQKDAEAFAKLREGLGWNAGSFYCHKGVPIDLEHETPTDSGFAYPTKAGKPDTSKMRFCRGYLNTLPKFVASN